MHVGDGYLGFRLIDRQSKNMTVSAISTCGTVWRDCIAEGLRLILTHMGVEMTKQPVTTKVLAETVLKDIWRATRKLHG